MIGLFVGACFLGGEGVLDRGFVEVYFVGSRGDVKGWLDVLVVLSCLQEEYKPPCRLAWYFLAFGRAAIGAGLVVKCRRQLFAGHMERVRSWLDICGVLCLLTGRCGSS